MSIEISSSNGRFFTDDIIGEVYYENNRYVHRALRQLLSMAGQLRWTLNWSSDPKRKRESLVVRLTDTLLVAQDANDSSAEIEIVLLPSAPD